MDLHFLLDISFAFVAPRNVEMLVPLSLMTNAAL